MTNRKLRMETLEQRSLLAVVAGGAEQTVEFGSGPIAPTEAVTWVVNTTEDPTSWEAGDDQLSLREAIGRAVAGDTITFDSTLAERTITLNGTQLEIGECITIDATGIGGMTIDGNEQSKVLSITGGTVEFPVELIALTITGGKSVSNGGGIANYYGTLTLINCMITGNTASSKGGGIYNNSGTLKLINCTVARNNTSSGGGIYNSGTLTLTNCTIEGNTVGYGSGIYNSRTSYLYNSIVRDVKNSGKIYAYNTLSDFTAWTESSDCLIYDSTKPLFANTSANDYSLANKSQAINVGNNSYATTETDLVGNPRIKVGVVDLGAYEYQTECSFTIVTTLDDVVDDQDSLISLREAVTLYALKGDTVTFDASLAGGTVTLSGSEIEITKGVTIDASAIGGITIDGGGLSRVFNVSAGTNGRVSLVGLMVTEGNAEQGGGIYNDPYSILNLNDCTVTGNTATQCGGIYSSGTLTLTNCIVSRNTADYGGGIYNNTGTLALTNCTISENNASYGGGIYNGGTLTLSNCTVAGNGTSFSGDIDNSGTSYLYNSIILTVINSSKIYAYNTLSDFTAWTRSSNCRTYDSAKPLFEDTSANDYSLAEYSQAINVGNNSYVTTETDLAGNPRIKIGIVDLGAYEYQTEFSSTIVTTLDDVVDNQDNLISLREAATLYALKGETVTFAAGLAGGTITLAGSEIEIAKGITIDASANGGITVDGDGLSRVFYISSGTNGTVSLVGLTVTGGNADSGAGIDNNGTLTLTDCTVAGNTSSYGGGGITNNDTLTLTNCTVVGNTASSGGGVYNSSGTTTLTDCTLSRNNAGNTGGGIYNGGDTLMLTNCTIEGNNASSGGGGGIYNGIGPLTLTDCTLSRNNASDTGGGIYNGSDTLTLTNCTVVGNNASSGGGIDNSKKTSLYNSVILGITSSKTISAYNTLSDFTAWTESSECLTYDAAKPLFTDPENGDYTLAEGSQAINQGNNDYATVETDLAGDPRICHNIVDLGAYEYQRGLEPFASPTISTGTSGVYVSYGANRHRITWNAVENAENYELAYSADGGFTWLTVAAAETSAVITGLSYGVEITYRVRVLGIGAYADSEWSASKTFMVCPMDINGDGDISNSDRALLSPAWLSEEGDDNFRHCCDIDGNGEITNSERAFLAANWLAESKDDGLVYPASQAADAVFGEYTSADLDIELDIF
jgi:Fe-S cluster assembly iron-binding protein IscA